MRKWGDFGDGRWILDFLSTAPGVAFLKLRLKKSEGTFGEWKLDEQAAMDKTEKISLDTKYVMITGDGRSGWRNDIEQKVPRGAQVETAYRPILQKKITEEEAETVISFKHVGTMLNPSGHFYYIHASCVMRHASQMD